MISRVYKVISYLANIALMAIVLGAGALAVIVMLWLPVIGLACVVGAIAIDLISKYDARLNKKGDQGHDRPGE